MKKIDSKDNKKLTSVVAMILAVCVVIGLLSSTTIKLASATLLMKNSKIKNIPIIGDIISDVVDQPVQSVDPAPAPAPSTPSNSAAPATPATTKPTEAPSAEAPTTQEPTSAKEEETKAPEVKPEETKAPTTKAPETKGGQTVAEKQAILKSYKDVVARAKVNGRQPSFAKATYRSLKWDFFGGIFYKDVAGEHADYFVSEEAAKASPVVVSAKTASDKLCIENVNSACLLDANDTALVDKAVKSASKETLKDGTVKIVINLNDEENPAPLKAGKTDGSFTSTMFPVLTGEQVRVAMNNKGVEKIDLTYKNCSVELIYKPATGQIISLKQTTGYVADVTNGYIPASGTVTEVSEYYNFVY